MAARRSLVTASLCMIVLTVLLTFLPLFNGLFGGGAGGYLAGSFRRALAAALLPALFVFLVIDLALERLGAIGLESLGGLSAGSVAGVSGISLLLGAAFGGHLAGRRRSQQLGTPKVAASDRDAHQDDGPKWLPRPPRKL